MPMLKMLKLLLLTLWTLNLEAADSLSYSGRLVNADGSPVAGPVNLRIELAYSNAPTTVLCSQDVANVALSNGVFHLKLDLVCGSGSLADALVNVPPGESASLRVIDVTHTKNYGLQAIHSVPFSNISDMARQLVQMGATDGQALKWNNTTKKWEPGLPVGMGTVTNVTVTAPLTVSNGTSVPAIAIPQANTTTSGYLSSADWNTFNGKQGNIVAGTTSQYYRGDKSWQTLDTSAVAENIANLYFTNARALGVPLTGFTVGAGAITNTDTVLDAFGKAQGQINAINTAAANFLVKNGTDAITGTVNVGITGALTITNAPALPTDAANKQYVDTKLDLTGGTLSGDLSLNTQLKLKNGGAANYVTIKAPATGSTAYTLSLPLTAGSASQVLTTDGAGALSWTTPSTTATPTGAAGGDLSGNYPNPTITGLAATKISGGAVDNTEFDYLNGVTSSIQTQLNAKEGTLTAGTSAQYYRGDKSWQTLDSSVVPENTNLYFTNARVLGVPLTGFAASNAAIVATDTVLEGMNKAQGQINNIVSTKASLAGDIFTGDVSFNTKIKLRDSGTNYVQITAPATVTSTYTLTLPATAGSSNQVLTTDGAGALTWTTPSTTATPSGAAGGDLTGTYPNPTIAAGKVVDATVSATANIAQSKIANLTTDLAAKLGSALTNGNIFVGNGSNVATGVAMSGDATIANTGAVTLKNTGTAGTYTSVTTDAQGRVTGGSNPVASATTSGDLSSTDWNTFNNKQAALSAGATINGIVYPANGTQTLQIPLAPVNANDAVNKAYVDSFGQWTISGGNIYRSSGNVGIGTNAPGSRLTVEGATNDSTSGAIQITNTVNTAGNSASASLKLTSGSSTAKISSINSNYVFPNRADSLNIDLGTLANGMTVSDGSGLFIKFLAAGSTFYTPVAFSTNISVNGSVKVGADGTGCTGANAGAMRFTSPNVEYCNGTAWTVFAVSGAAVSSAQITDGSIVDADVSATANIAATKLGTGAVDNTELNYLDGVTSSIQTQLNNKQAGDATLTALAAYNTNGILVQTAADTFTARTITGTANRLTVTNGDGVSGNPTINIPTALLPSPVVGDVGKFLKATAADTSVWTALGSSDITTALGFTPVNKAGDTIASGTFTFNGTAVLRTLDPVGLTDVATKQYVDGLNYWSTSGGNIYRSSGNVGIGTSAPGQALAVNGSETVSGYLRVGGNTAPSNTTAGDLTASRLIVGSTALTGSAFGKMTGTLSDTAAGAASGASVVSTINPGSASSSDFRSFDMSSTVSSSFPVSSVEGGWFEVRMTGTSDITSASGSKSIGLMMGSTAQNFGTVADAASYAAIPVMSSANTATGTITTGRGLRVQNSVITNQTLTNQVGVSIDPLTTATNNTALLIGASGVPAGNFSIYNASTLSNYFAGSLGIGTASPQAKLDVNGAVRVGADATACSGANAGAMRFTSPNIEYCNGTAWAAFETAGSAVASAQITDGTIVNADINAAANIDATKLGTGVVDNTEFNYLNGVTSAIQTQLNGKQASDATLTALAAYNTNGILVQTAADTFTARTITGTANRLTVSNGDGVAGNPTLNIPTALLPSPVVGDVGKFLKATAADTSVWTALSSSDITTALGFTPVNKAGDTVASGTFTFNGAAVVRTLDPVGPTDVATKQYVDGFGQWTAGGGNVYRTTGNVGIGNPSPLKNLDISGATDPTIRLSEGGSTTSYTDIVDYAPTQMLIRKVTASGDNMIDINPLPSDGVSRANVRFFRETNSTGTKRIQIHKGDGTATVDAQIGVGENSWFNAGGGYVGIGTSSPAAKLHVSGGKTVLEASTVTATYSVAPATYDVLDVYPIVYQSNADGGISLHAKDNLGYSRWSNRFAMKSNAGGIPRGALDFISRDASNVVTTNVEVLSYLTTGAVGIGTINPQSKLDVNGSVRVGADATACSAANAGAMRFTSPNVEYCNGTNWLAFNNTANGSVSSAQITDGSIVDADVSATANIAQSKIANLTTDLAAKQTLDATLTALAAYNTNGILVQTAADTFVGRSIAGTANRVSVTNGDGVASNPTINLDTTLLPSPIAGDAGKFLKASGANASSWTALGPSDITTALGFTPVNKAGDTIASGTFTFNGAAVLRTLDPVGLTDVVTKQYVDGFGQWTKAGSDIYRSSGNVGIGVAPAVKLHVHAMAEGQTAPVEAMRIDGPNSPAGSNSAQDLKWSFSSAGSAGIRAFRGGSWDTTLQFLTNSSSTLADSPQVRMTIDGVGNVGIGTVSPSAALHLNPTIAGGGPATSGTTPSAGMVARFANPGGATLDFGMLANGTQWLQATSTSNQANYYSLGLNPNGGYVGIGTTAPAAKLHLQGSDGRAITFSPGTINQDLNFIHNDNSNVNARYANITGILQDGGAGKNYGHISFSTAPLAAGNPATVERMRITGDGSVGIGTSSPLANLTIKHTTGEYATSGLILQEQTGASVYNFINSGGSLYIGHNTNSAGGFPQASYSTPFFISPTEKVGIGTNGPTANLHVFSSTASGYTTIVNHNGAAGGQAWTWYSGSTGSPLGANQMCLGAGGVCLMVLNTSGGMTISGTLTENSDFRLKRDINLIPHALDSVSALNGVTYYWKDSSKGLERQVGLIAQNVEKVFPEAVKTDKQGLKSVAYQNLVAPLVESIKEIKNWLVGHDKELSVQKREIASLKDENLVMKKQLEKQQQEIDELKKLMRSHK